MIENLRESFLFERLPQAIISLDERGLIQAVVGGFQDRLEDLRAYGKKMQLFFSVYGLPDGENNVVSVVLTSAQGRVYKRSLDISAYTPSATNPIALRLWAASQLGLPEETLGTVQYDRDLLRLVDTSVLELLAGTIGAILYQSSLVPANQQDAANRQLVNTYFPRLRIKGTIQSFDVLGRALGFDDVRITPLWSRMSPRRPEDVGHPDNDADYLPQPEFYPRQDISVLYDPLAVTDGPYHVWTGTCSSDIASTSYYLNAVNGFNPWVSVSVLGNIANGTAAHVAAGSYALAGGAPNQKAYVEPVDSSFRFEALVEGAAMNGVVLSVGTFGYNGTDRTLSIHERLSSIKYRASYFDLGLTVDIDSVTEVFGTQPVSVNKDIASGNYTMDGVSGIAVSPYRPWQQGTLATTLSSQDFYTQVVVSAGTTVVVPRVQATGTDRELIVDNLIAAGLQITQSLEEVRPASRFPRKSAVGLLIDEPTHFACYTSVGTLFTTNSAILTYGGSHALTPLGAYTADLVLFNSPSGTACQAETSVDPTNGTIWNYAFIDPAFNGTYNFGNGTYAVQFPVGVVTGGKMVAIWTVSDSEVIRPEPTLADKLAGRFNCQVRPEDEVNGLVDEQVDDYPWLREVVGGGEQVEIDTYIPEGAPVDVVSYTTAFQSQCGVDVNVYGLESQNGQLRILLEDRPYDSTYEPGIRAIAYQGEFVNLATINGSNLAMIRPASGSATGTYGAPTDYEVLFKPGFAIYHAGVVQNVLVADPVKFFGTHHRDGIVGWLPLNEHPEEDLVAKDVARTIPVVTDMVGVLPEHRVWSSERGWYLDLHPDCQVRATVSRGLHDTFSISFWVKPGRVLADARIVSYDPVFVDMVAGSMLNFYARDTGGALVLLGTRVLFSGVWNFVTVTKSATGYSFGLGTLMLPVSASAYAGPAAFLPFDEVENSTLVLSAPTAIAQSAIVITNKLDIVFCIDWSGSMDSTISALILAISSFDAALTAAGFDVSYGFISFGLTQVQSEPHPSGVWPWTDFYQNLTDVTTFSTKLNAYFASVPRTGNFEYGSATVSRACTEANWRPGSNRFVVLFTNENDDSGPDGEISYLPSVPNPAVIAKAYTDLTALGATFSYAGNVSRLGTTPTLGAGSVIDDPYVYQALADTFGGKGYELATFILDPSEMLLDIVEIASIRWTSGAYLGFHDVRVWDSTKTVDDLNLVRYHEPVPTQVLYQMSFIETANRQDRYALRVMDSAWLTPDVMPPWYRTSRTGLVRRYASDGFYTGASRFKEVGLGDGHELPSQMFLGYVVPSVESGGTAVVSGSWGALPGVNTLWARDTLVLSPLDQCNPIRDAIWIKGVDGGVYEVTLVGSIGETRLAGEAVYTGTNIFAGSYSQQLTGAEVVLATGGMKCFYSAVAGTVVELADAGGTQTPPQWLYLHQRVTDSYQYSRWTKAGFTAQQQGVDILGNSGVVAIAGDVNSALLIPALGENGRLDFENNSTFAPGRYRLTLESGNIGPTDEDFDGFTVELNLNENVIQTVLLRGQNGFNVRGTDVLEFITTTPPVVGSWLLSVRWFNALRDASKGTMRQLAIYDYKVEVLATEVFQVAVNPSPSALYPEVTSVAYVPGVPGGWLMRVNSYGTVVTMAHEGAVYPENDTVTSKFPLANVLTGMTNDKRDDIIVSSISPPSFLASGTVTSAPVAPVAPTFGPLIAV